MGCRVFRWGLSMGLPSSYPVAFFMVWQRCVPTEVQRLTWLAAAEFASAQSDAYVNPEEVGNPEGGWEDGDYMFDAPWEEEAWDDSGAY